MMKVALKHWLCEVAIEQFFKCVDQNFFNLNKSHNIKYGQRFGYNRTLYDVRVGSRFYYIYYASGSNLKSYLFDCTVTSIKKRYFTVDAGEFKDIFDNGAEEVRGTVEGDMTVYYRNILAVSSKC